MAKKCMNKGCEKTFTDPEEECYYHPGPPIFHEGQKGWKGTHFISRLLKLSRLIILHQGWKCCKPRVLTFEDFLKIPPCTTGKHSTEEQPTHTASELGAATGIASSSTLLPMLTLSKEGTETYGTPERRCTPIPKPRVISPTERKEKVVEEDDPSLLVPPEAKCKRNACDVVYESEHMRKVKC